MSTRPTIDNELLRRIDDLAARTTLTREELIEEALRGYLDWQEEFVTAVHESIVAAERGELASEAEVERVFDKYKPAD